MATNSSYGNGTVLNAFNLIDVVLDGSGLFTSQFIDVSQFTSFYMTVFNDNTSLDVDLEYSFNGQSDVPKKFINTTTVAASAFVVDVGSFNVKSRYLRMVLQGTIATTVTVQLVFRDGPPTLLKNVGGQTEVYVNNSNGCLRTLESSDTSVTITQNAETIDFTVAGATGAVFQEISSVISPITATETSMHVGLNNIIPTSATSSFCFGESNYMRDPCVNCFINGDSNGFTGANVNVIRNSGFLASQQCTADIEGGATPCVNSVIIASVLSELEGAGGADRGVCQCAVIACDASFCGGQDVGPRKVINSAIIAGANHEIAGYGGDGVNETFIIGGSDCRIGTTTATTGREQTNCSILGSTGCNIGPSNDIRFNCCILNGNDSHINTLSNNSTLIGSHITCTHDGSLMFSDSGGGTPLVSTNSNRFDVRCAGGSTFYSNTANTTGVSLAAGAGSWASVCDENKKENKEELDYDKILDNLKKIKVYKYNYIGNHKNIRCFGPMAQEWHSTFPCDDIEITDEDGITAYKEAKDTLQIESNDIIGVCLASIKSLTGKMKILEDRIYFLENQDS